MKSAVFVLAALALLPRANAAVTVTNVGDGFRAQGGAIAIQCSRDLRFRVFLEKSGRWITLSPETAPTAAISVKLGSHDSALLLTGPPTAMGNHVILRASDAGSSLGAEIVLDFPERYPDVVVLRPHFINTRSSGSLKIDEVRQAALALLSDERGFWSMQGGGYKWGEDFILPVRAGFRRDNYTGPKGDGNGGGMPFVDLWRPEMGVAVALLDPKPVLAWVPVEIARGGLARVNVTTKPAAVVAAGASYDPAPAMIAVHTGDFYDPVVRYRQLMTELGVAPVTEYVPADYAPSYCTWGYQRNFTMDEVLAKLPQMQELGMTDFILDDGWFDLFGNWLPTRAKFPNGETDMKAAIQKIHAAGMKFRLWWSPGSADPGSDIDRRHADWFILDQSGRKAKASWNAYYLCPAYPPVREATKQLVRRFVTDWSTDSFKLDGTDLNHAPLCYNPAHHHKSPEESFEQWPELMREIRAEARRLRPGFRVELCPCGITPTYQLATAMEQPTDSDPFIHQITQRTKFLKAMFGPRTPVLQEYVGVSVETQARIPSSVDVYPRAIGTGEVPSTFTTKIAEKHARWTKIYNRHRPAEGEYLNLYDTGWEAVEGHAIRKGAKLYYGFFTRQPGADFTGNVKLRGLDARRYRVTDYANDRDLGSVTGPSAELKTAFHDALLVVAEPAESAPSANTHPSLRAATVRER